MIEIFGYCAMIVVLISFLMQNIKTLRILNIIGCSMFIIYGSILNLTPVIIMNILVVIINLYYIFKGK